MGTQQHTEPSTKQLRLVTYRPIIPRKRAVEPRVGWRQAFNRPSMALRPFRALRHDIQSAALSEQVKGNSTRYRLPLSRTVQQVQEDLDINAIILLATLLHAQIQVHWQGGFTNVRGSSRIA